jgi:hypothetical protein
MHYPITPAGGGPLKPKRRKPKMNELMRTWSWDGQAWAILRIIISPQDIIGSVEFDFGCNKGWTMSRSCAELLREWVAGTLRNPDYLPTTVRRVWLHNRTLGIKVDCLIHTEASP